MRGMHGLNAAGTCRVRVFYFHTAASVAPCTLPGGEDSSAKLYKLGCLALAAGVAGVVTAGSSWRQVAQCEPIEIGRAKPSPVRCETTVVQGSANSIIMLDVENDHPGLLAEASDLLKRHKLDVKDARITTDGPLKARHIYTVRDKATGRPISEDKLEEIRKALETLGQVECTAKAWPCYTMEEVSKHTSKENRIWVTYKDGVYDITDFIVNHPGGSDKIMLAAGKAIDPFWRIYQQHEGRDTAVQMLAKMRIGDLADPVKVELGDDPYDADPERHPGLIFHNNKPCNAELPPEMLMDSWSTPNPVWFIRHHHPVPVTDPDKYRLFIEGEGTSAVKLSMEDLKTRFVKREVTTTIQCGGNRRSDLNSVEKTSGIPWGFGAISTATWGGVALREVLMHCGGLSLEAVEWNGLKHVIFHALDTMQASIPIEKALSPYGDVLLAYEMNGEPLSEEHGSPLRLIVPGVVGVRNVKWVGRIETSKVEAEGPWQRGIAYKGLSPMIKDVTGIDLDTVASIQEMPVQSVIVSPKPGTVTELDDIEVKGFAWSGGGRGINRVDVSIDNGRTWTTADLKEGSQQPPSRAWAWTFWEASVTVPEAYRGGEVTVLCRATDTSYNTQPERAEPIWNLRGLNCNCWHHVKVFHDDSDAE